MQPHAFQDKTAEASVSLGVGRVSCKVFAMTTPRTLSIAQARAFAVRALGLAPRGVKLAEVVDRLGYVQLDPLNVCGRMHELILRNRVEGYVEGALSTWLHSEKRPGFEHYLPGAGILVAFGWEAWPHLQATMDWRKGKEGYLGALSVSERGIARDILEEIRERGPLVSEQLDHYGRGKTAWGASGRKAKAILEKLFAHGVVLMSARRDFRRVYDLAERVLPARLLTAKAASKEETARWLVVLKLRQRRLALLKRQELPLVEDLVQPLRVEGLPPLYCLRSDLALLEAGAEMPGEALLLAPLDPLVYDRKLTSLLWDFDYTWEVYTPAHKRVRGYYALPVLSKGELVGHVEPRIDRETGKLQVLSRQLRRGHSPTVALKTLQRFLSRSEARTEAI
jgi:uncharacterized protein YcaQ